MLRRILPRKRDRMILLPVIGSQLIVTTSLFLMPILIDTLKDRGGLSGKATGLVLSTELAASALTTLCLSAWVRDHSTRRWALAGGVLATLCTALALISPSLPLLFTTRLIAGIGAGVVGAEATSVLSRGIERERLIAIVTVASIVDAAVWLAVLPYIVDRLGYRAPYLCLLLVCLCGTLLMVRLPSLCIHKGAAPQTLRSPFAASAVLAIIAVFLTQLGQGAFWSMEGYYGSNASFSSHATGVILSFSTLLLLLGAIGAAWAADRFDRHNSLLILIAVNAASILLVSMIAVHWLYVVANALQAVTNLSAVIYQLALSASLDRLGRAVAISTALVTLGNGIGPGISAGLCAAFGAPFVVLFVLALNIVAFGLYCTVKLGGMKGQTITVCAT